MTLREFKTRLEAQPAARVAIVLPNRGSIPPHFHVTEVGHVAKNFVDCGGKFRASESCVLQTWMAGQTDDGHRLTAGKLAHILGLADSILPSGDLPVEVEYEQGVISQFPIQEITVRGGELTIQLGLKHTDCLARERCGVSGGEDGASEDEAGCCAGSAEPAGQRCCG